MLILLNNHRKIRNEIKTRILCFLKKYEARVFIVGRFETLEGTTKMRNEFESIPCLFAGTEPVVLTVYAPHLLQRWVERLGHSFQNGKQCAEVISSYLADERLITVFERVPVYGSVALYIESLKTLFFMDMGTRKDPNEIKVSTVLYRANESQRFLVDAEDYCYILPKEGKLRFGKERKYFELKKRAPKWRPSHQT